MAPIVLSPFSPWILLNLSTTPKLFTAGNLDDDTPNYNQAAAYLSARILTVGGVVLFLMGLCCIGAVLLRFARCQGREGEIQRIEYGKPQVIDQETLDRSVPIRIWPSKEELLINSENKVVPMASIINTSITTTATTTPTNTTSTDHERSQLKTRQGTTQQKLKGLFFKDRIGFQGSSPSPERDRATITEIPLSTIWCSEGSGRRRLDAKEKEEGDDDTATVAGSVSHPECCSICIGDYEIGDRIRVLPCGHEYHTECVDIWLTNKSTHCPLCKHDLLDDIDPLLLACPSSPSSIHSEYRSQDNYRH